MSRLELIVMNSTFCAGSALKSEYHPQPHDRVSSRPEIGQASN